MSSSMACRGTPTSRRQSIDDMSSRNSASLTSSTTSESKKYRKVWGAVAHKKPTAPATKKVSNKQQVDYEPEESSASRRDTSSVCPPSWATILAAHRAPFSARCQVRRSGPNLAQFSQTSPDIARCPRHSEHHHASTHGPLCPDSVAGHFYVRPACSLAYAKLHGLIATVERTEADLSFFE
ncbi:hypothetical protein VTI74DRAFT_7476 [Chaetomium olivicolor]